MIGRRLDIKRRAERDIEAIERYYLEEVSWTVSDAAVDAILEKAQKLAELDVDYREGILAGTREYVMDRFPYVLIYRNRPGVVERLRVLHQRTAYFNQRR